MNIRKMASFSVVITLSAVILSISFPLWAAEGDTAGRQGFPAVLEAKQRAVLSAEMTGVLTKLAYDVGAAVQKGEVIAAVDTRELALQKKRSEVALRHLGVRVSDLANLNKQGLATNEDLARARMERDVTRTDLEILNLQIAKSTIRAPFNSLVVERHVHAHEWVTAGQPVVDILNLEALRAVANIPTHLAVTLKPGQAHTIHIADLNADVPGKLLSVVPEVDERSDTARVIWTLDKPVQGLLPGMKGEVYIDG